MPWVLQKADAERAQQSSWLGLVDYSLRVLEQLLELLGIDIPERM